MFYISGVISDNKPSPNDNYTMSNLVNGKKVEMKLVGLDGNAFSLMGAFSYEARHQGWTKEEIDTVLNECRKKDYYHLLSVLVEHTTGKDLDD